jgi:hypothetical protein
VGFAAALNPSYRYYRYSLDIFYVMPRLDRRRFRAGSSVLLEKPRSCYM